MAYKLCRKSAGGWLNKITRTQKRKTNCIPQTSPTQWRCVTMFLSQSYLLLAHVAVPPTHTPTLVHPHITTRWQHVHTVGFASVLQRARQGSHYLTKLSFTPLREKGSVHQLIWPSSDTHSKSALPRFCLHKQEPVPVCCIIQSRLCSLNEQSAGRGDVRRAYRLQTMK